MNKKLSLALKIAVITLASIGALIVCAVVFTIGWQWYHDAARQAPQDIQRLRDVWGGHVAPQGIIVRHVNKTGAGVTASYSLVQQMFKHEIDPTHQLVVVSWRDIKSDVVEKFERGDVEIAKFAATAALEDLVQVHLGYHTSAGVIAKTDKGWEAAQWDSDFVYVAEDDPVPVMQMIALADKAPVLSVVTPTQTRYFAAVGKEFKLVFDTLTRHDDLDACLEHEASEQRRENERLERAKQKAHATQAASQAASSVASSASASESGEDEEAEEAGYTPADFYCVRMQASVKLLPSETQGFKDLSVSVLGTDRERKEYKREILLKYSAREREYQYRNAEGRMQSHNDLISETLLVK